MLQDNVNLKKKIKNNVLLFMVLVIFLIGLLINYSIMNFSTDVRLHDNLLYL